MAKKFTRIVRIELKDAKGVVLGSCPISVLVISKRKKTEIFATEGNTEIKVTKEGALHRVSVQLDFHEPTLPLPADLIGKKLYSGDTVTLIHPDGILLTIT